MSSLISQYSKEELECIDRPSKEDLFNIIQTNKGSFVAVGKMFGVTDNTIRKWCVGYGLPSHTSDYKEKTQPKTKQPRTPPTPIKQIDKSTNETIAQFASIREAQSITLIEHIGDVVNGKRKSAGGYYWVKID